MRNVAYSSRECTAGVIYLSRDQRDLQVISAIISNMNCRSESVPAPKCAGWSACMESNTAHFTLQQLKCTTQTGCAIRNELLGNADVHNNFNEKT